MVAANADRAVVRRMARTIFYGVADQLHRRLDREDPGAAADHFLEDIVLGRSAQGGDVVAALFRHREIHGYHDGGGAVDSERHGDLVEVDAVEGDLEIAQAVDRHADAPDLAFRGRIVAVQPALGGQIEGDVEAGVAGLDQVVEALVGRLRVAEAGILAHRPGAPAVHVAMDAAGEGILAGLFPARPVAAAASVAAVQVRRRVDRLYLDAGVGEDRLHAPWQITVGQIEFAFDVSGQFLGHRATFSSIYRTMSSSRLRELKTASTPISASAS